MNNVNTESSPNRFCCSYIENNPEEILGEDARGIKDLFPTLIEGIIYGDDKERSLCPAFMKSGSASFSFIHSDLGMKQQLIGSIEQKEENLVIEAQVNKEDSLLEVDTNTTIVKAKNENSEPVPAKEKHNKKFTHEEDEKLKDLVNLYGEGAWSKIAENMEGRNRKQVRERYINFLKKDRVVGEFTPEEDAFIIQHVQRIGRKWSKLSGMMTGRTPIMIKNRYYAKLKKIIDNCAAKEDGSSSLGVTVSPPRSQTGSIDEVIVLESKPINKKNHSAKASKDSLNSEEEEIEMLELKEKDMQAALETLREKIEMLKSKKSKNEVA